ncbi:MAG: ribosome-associated translation inhibitor RaiA [bacterium]
MQINIKATQIELTDSIRDYVQIKMDMLDKFLGSIDPLGCDVEVGMTTARHNKGEIFRAEVNLQLAGKLLRVEKTEKELYKAIDKVKDHLARSIVRYKEKKIDMKRRA